MLTFDQGILAAQLAVFVGQLWVFNRQKEIMAGQTALMTTQQDTTRAQLELLRRQADVERDSAIGTFYRLAFDLAAEFAKINDATMLKAKLGVDYGTHPRQVLREASSRFAALGNTFVMALNQVGLALDEYFLLALRFDAVESLSHDKQECLNGMTDLRRHVGAALDQANRQIPDGLRWTDGTGDEFNFTRRLSVPPPKRRIPSGQ